jgi:hypothetical protein
MLEYIIIKILLNNNYYIKYYNYIDLEYYKINNINIYKILLLLKTLHEKEKRDVSLEELEVFYYSSYPSLRMEEKVLISSIFKKVESVQVEESVLTDYFTSLKTQAVAGKIALEALNITKGNGSLSRIHELLSESDSVQIEGIPEDECTHDIIELLNSHVKGGGYLWRQKSFNVSLGPLRQGDFGFLFARPETGKTTLLADLVTNVVDQGADSVLWVNNEESNAKVMLRLVQAAFGITKDELESSPDKWNKLFSEKYGAIHLMEASSANKKDVERWCEKYKPKLIVFDQLDKIRWYDDERHDLKLKAIYQWAREMAKKYAPFLAVCQAGGTGENKRYLNMNDVDSSHTAKQGEADFMIGLGMVDNDAEKDFRYISLCKNKLVGSSDTREDLRHAKMALRIRPTIGRYEDFISF